MPAQSHRIFVSHSHLDNNFGTKFVQDLRRALGDESAVWYDVLGGLHGGEIWWEKIVEELTARDVFIVALSPDAMKSSWVRREITMAINEGKFILPVLYRSCSIRADLKILQIISFLAPKPYEQAFREVLLALGLPTSPPIEPVKQAQKTKAQWLEEGKALHNHKRYEEALAAYDQAIRLDPNSAWAIYNKGVALESLGKKTEAQQAYARARVVDPKSWT